MFRNFFRNFDYLLFGAVIILGIFGIIMIQSAVAGSPGLDEVIRRQPIFFVASIIVMLGVSFFNYRFWSSFTIFMYAFAFLFLILIYVAGKTAFGAQRWLEVGTVLLQPAELAKIVIILVLAHYFSKNHDVPHDLLWVTKSLVITFGLVIWILLQPNLSTSIIVLVIWFTMMWIEGVGLKSLIVLGAVGLVAAVIFALFFMQDYQKTRIQQFISPETESRHGNTYNVEQALISVGSGGLFGQGYGHGTQVQLRYLKVRHSDFIFSAMAEEFGFIGTTLVISVLVLIILRCIRAARMAADRFGALIAYGFAILIFFQSAVNIGVNLNVLPVTGITLPFISAGGSSLVSLGLGMGLIESIVVHRKA